MDVSKLTPEQEELFSKLNVKQQSLATAVLNNEEPQVAHERIYGTSKRKSKDEFIHSKLASEILNKPEVKQFIDSVKKEEVEQVQTARIMSRQEMAERLTAIATGNIYDVVEFQQIEVEDAEGNIREQTISRLKTDDELDERGRAILQGIGMTKNGTLMPNIHDQKAAMKQLSELMGYNRNIDGEDAKLTQEERVLGMIGTNAVTDEKLD